MQHRRQAASIVGNRDRIDEKMIDLAYDFGEKLGMAYQVKDDLLDLMGEEAVIGKPIFTDLKSGKRNIVLIHSLQNSSQQDKDFITGLFFKERYTDSEISRSREIFSGCGAVEHAEMISDRYAESAKDLIRICQISAQRKSSLELSDYLVVRNS